MDESFYGLAREWFKNDRFYKAYVTKETVLAVRVGGQFFDKISVRVQLAPFYLTLIGIPLVELITSWADNRRLRSEARAENDLDLAAQRDDSLVIAISDIQNVELSSRRHWWTIWINSGTITIKCRNRADIKFVLTAHQDRKQIAAMFSRHEIPVTGNS